MNPYGDDLIVDQVIGSAYQVVKYVASNMETLIQLSDFIQTITVGGLVELIEFLPELQEIYDNLPAIIDSSLVVAASREAIVRSYNEAGFPMDKTESFEVGGTITTAKETLLYEQNGVGYTWGGALPKIVPADSTPATTGGIGPSAWIDQSTKLLRQQLIAQTGNLTIAASWADVPSFSDPELGGPGGPMNRQAEALVARSELLRIDLREALRRSYAEAGYNLVDGSFEVGGTLVNANDVLLQESTGKAFSGPAGAVAAGTNPASGGFVDVSASVGRCLKTVTELRGFAGTTDGSTVLVAAHNLAVPIEVPARYVFKAASAKEDNDGTYIKPNVGAGCWEMIIENDEIDVRWFGAVGDGVTDDVPAITKCRRWMASVSFSRKITMVFGGSRDYYLNSYATNPPHPWDACIHLDTNMSVNIPTGSKWTIGPFRDQNYLLVVSLVGATGWDQTKNTEGVPIDNVSVFGGGVIDFTKSGSMDRTNVAPKPRNFLSMLNNSNFEMHGLKFIGSATHGDLSNVVASLPCKTYGNKARVHDCEFVDLVCSATTNYDHSTIYINSTDAQVYGNTFKAYLPKSKLVASACELHNSGGKFFNNRVINYTNAAIVAFQYAEHPASVNIGSVEVYSNDIQTVRGMCYLHFDAEIAVHGAVLIHDNMYKMQPYLTQAEHDQTWFNLQESRHAIVIYNEGTTSTEPNVESIKIYNNTCIENQTNFNYSDSRSDTIFITHANNAPPRNIEVYNNYIKFSKLFGYLPSNNVPANRRIVGWRFHDNTHDMGFVAAGKTYFNMAASFILDCVFEFKDPVNVPTSISAPLFVITNADGSFGGASRITIEDPDFLRHGGTVATISDNLFTNAFGSEITVPASFQLNYTVEAGVKFGYVKVTNGTAPYDKGITPGVTSVALPSYDYDGSVFDVFPKTLDSPNNNGAATGLIKTVAAGPVSGYTFTFGYKKRVNV